MPGGRRNERVTSLFFEDSATDPVEEGEVVRNGNDVRGLFGGSVQSLIATAAADVDKIVTARSDAMVLVTRSNGNVITRR